MQNDLKGKKLLILCGVANEITLVTRARELGVYTIVADSNTDWKLSPAKAYADEVWDVSWSDLDALEQRCREAGVDGVVAGYSEFRVENQIRLCRRLNLPCCTTLDQLDITRNKDKFKNACRAYGVPVVHEYESVEAVKRYPVIVKPVDRAGSIGISVANDPRELKQAYDYALECSPTRTVIIEDFITDGTKVDVYYAVCDGKIYYLSSNDVLNAAGNGTEKIVQSAWLYHSVHEAQYLEEVDPAMRSFIRNIGIRDGYMFFSTFWTPRGFVLFEMGLRLCGGHMYSILPAEGKLNNLDLYIRHALTGNTASLQYDEGAARKLYTATVNVYAREGTVAEIRGLEEAKQLPACCLAVQHGYVGQVCTEDKAILTKIGMAIFSAGEPGALERDIREFYRGLAVTGTLGQDMIYDRVDPAAVAKWWN